MTEEASLSLRLKRPLQLLKPHDILQIDQALAEVGPLGEVWIIKEQGQLRSIVKVVTKELSEAR